MKFKRKPLKVKRITSQKFRLKEKRPYIYRDRFPKKFPFWARLKIGKNRTTLVIDEEAVEHKRKKRLVPGFVHREATHTAKKDFLEIKPNPDKSDKKPMYLRRPSKLPQELFAMHNKKLDMPDFIKEKYQKNNKK